MSGPRRIGAAAANDAYRAGSRRGRGESP